MNSLFPDWYQPTCIEVNGDELNKRWQGVEAFNKRIKKDDALEALRLFNDIPTRNVNFKEQFGKVFQNIDPTFRIRNSDLELRILAGAALVKLLDKKNSALGDAIALAILCINSHGLYSNKMIMNEDVNNAALNYLLKRAVEMRSFDSVNSKQTIIESFNEAIESVKNACSHSILSDLKETIAEPFELLSDEIISNISVITKLEYELKLQREESNILWWLLGGHSSDLEKPISEFKLSTASLIVGKELADLTVVIPGPRSAPAFLDRMLRLVNPKLSDSVTIKDAINNAPQKWKEEWIAESKMEFVKDFCPIHSAVQKSVENGSDWVRTTKKSIIKVTAHIAPLDLALQVYQEALLIRFFSGE